MSHDRDPEPWKRSSAIEEGISMGSVAEVEAVNPDESDQIHPADGVVAAVAESSVPPHRSEQILMALDLQHQHLSAERQKQLRDLILSYCDVFACNPSELGTTRLVSHGIETGDHPPVCQQLRRAPFALRAKIDELVQEMIDSSIVQPSNSPWSSPVVLVKKKDGSVVFV